MSDAEPLSKPSSSELLNNLGPILATAFEKGFAAFVREWPLFAVGALAAICIAYVNVLIALAPPCLVLLYWSYRSFGNAARLFDPGYRMSILAVVRLVALGVIYVCAFLIGTLLLVAPAFWLCTKSSLAMVASLRHDGDLWSALKESWDRTTGRFWETLLFNVVVNIAGSAVAIVAELFATIALAVFGIAQNPHEADRLPTGWLGVLAAAAATLYLYAVAFAQQAIIMCQRMWLAALRGEPLPTRPIVPAELLP